MEYNIPTSFLTYLDNFYGEDGMYNDFFKDKKGLTKKQLLFCAIVLQATVEDFNCEDTFDREMVRDFAFFYFENSTYDQIEYGESINKCIEHPQYVTYVEANKHMLNEKKD
jgi:hypothetical protein